MLRAMKSILRIGLLVVVLGAGMNLLRAEKLFEGDSLGGVKIGQGEATVIQVLGKPGSRGKDVLWEAIGAWVQEWRFPGQGVTLAMGSEKKGGAKKVLTITAEGPCTLATSRGIRIGSTEGEVAKAYRALRNKEASEAGKVFVAGSIYGGVIFDFKGGKVERIFIGAAAE